MSQTGTRCFSSEAADISSKGLAQPLAPSTPTCRSKSVTFESGLAFLKQLLDTSCSVRSKAAGRAWSIIVKMKGDWTRNLKQSNETEAVLEEGCRGCSDGMSKGNDGEAGSWHDLAPRQQSINVNALGGKATDS